MTSAGLFRGVGPAGLIPRFATKGDPSLDGFPLLHDSSQEGGIRVGQPFGGTAYVANADATSTAQTLADVTGLVLPVLPASTYQFLAILKAVASADTNGMEVGVACSQTPVSVAAVVSGNTATTTVVSTAIIAAATATSAFNTSNAGIGIIEIRGQIITHATLQGNFSIQHLKVSSGTSTVKIGSSLTILKVA